MFNWLRSNGSRLGVLGMRVFVAGYAQWRNFEMWANKFETVEEFEAFLRTQPLAGPVYELINEVEKTKLFTKVADWLGK